MAFNIVELMTAGDENNGCDQPCKFGHRVNGHAVYCHNDNWHDSPRKCRRTWYSNGEIKDEDCPGFQPNPDFKGELNPSPQSADRCSQCGGSKLIPTDKGAVETCPRCMGDGAEPRAIELSNFAQDTLELCCVHNGKSPGQFENNVRIAENKSESDDIIALSENNLIEIRSMSFTKYRGQTVYLYRMTAKGDAVMRVNWEARKKG